MTAVNKITERLSNDCLNETQSDHEVHAEIANSSVAKIPCNLRKVGEKFNKLQAILQISYV